MKSNPHKKPPVVVSRTAFSQICLPEMRCRRISPFRRNLRASLHNSALESAFFRVLLCTSLPAYESCVNHTQFYGALLHFSSYGSAIGSALAFTGIFSVGNRQSQKLAQKNHSFQLPYQARKSYQHFLRWSIFSQIN